MKKLFLLLIILAGTFVVGCTPTETWGERNRRITRVNAMNLLEFNEDSDRLWLLEKSSKSNEWWPHVGF